MRIFFIFLNLYILLRCQISYIYIKLKEDELENVTKISNVFYNGRNASIGLLFSLPVSNITMPNPAKNINMQAQLCSR